jgi:hypothetical protein
MNESNFIEVKKGTSKDGKMVYIETPAKSNKTKVYIFGKDEIVTLKEYKLNDELKGGLK